MGSIGTLLVFLLGLQGYFKATALYPNGQLNPDAYPVFGATFAMIICAGVWASALGTHDQIGRLPQYTQGRRSVQSAQVLKDASRAFSLRSFKAMVATCVLWGMTMGMVTALSLYLGTLYFQFTLTRSAGVFRRRSSAASSAPHSPRR